MFNIVKIYWNRFSSFFDFKFNKRVKSIMVTGIKVCFIACLFSSLMLSLYITTNPSDVLFNLGITLFKSSTVFMAFFFICGIAFNKLLEDKVK